jgi:hypothetical protein
LCWHWWHAASTVVVATAISSSSSSAQPSHWQLQLRLWIECKLSFGTFKLLLSLLLSADTLSFAGMRAAACVSGVLAAAVAFRVAAVDCQLASVLASSKR